MTQTTKTISFSKELDEQLDKTIDLLNTHRIVGNISKSKIIRLAVKEWLDRQNRSLDILNERRVENGNRIE